MVKCKREIRLLQSKFAKLRIQTRVRMKQQILEEVRPSRVFKRSVIQTLEVNEAACKCNEYYSHMPKL
jgi:hypothetical protein